MPENAIDPGAFRLRLVLQSRPQVAGDLAGFEPDWAGDTIIWAAPVQRRAASSAGEAGTAIADRLQVMVRTGHAIEAGMRLVGDANVWRIVTVADPDLTGRYLLLELLAGETP